MTEWFLIIGYTAVSVLIIEFSERSYHISTELRLSTTMFMLWYTEFMVMNQIRSSLCSWIPNTTMLELCSTTVW